ncbi:hypothetical protein A1Q1_02940 [Trichosporon asahii var. asahii CBS 2479]|uniref:Uncharacterized protein n=1 Tax=Trichosporon asahii var. asahii (strain ATCC 90039 / CBS 2479 / JCM 2466 / KCTC 7840 / NBRC 103889/ NCYC 2677 / UAMH 7654) TaxID=1186058 RepID=J6ETZ9_TRIAS|nr:hypothetical protein A1Q1_02940 [Trichosporon asahii var. asahii CBS 2479]EJT48024.1 hypothetical protein A1Q1_02940 [Trichosporon asahii var. asahii CBS 2479]
MSVQTTSTDHSGQSTHRDAHSSPTDSINIHWQSSTEQWKSTVSFDPWQPNPFDPVVDQRASNALSFGAPHPSLKGTSISFSAKATEVDRYSLSRGPRAAMLEQERSIRAALCGLPYPSHDANRAYPFKPAHGAQGDREHPMPIGHGSIWAPKEEDGVNIRSRSPFLTQAELSHLPPKPCDPPPSYVDKAQAQEWPALGETKSMPLSKWPATSCDTSAPSKTATRYSDVATDAPPTENKSHDTIRVNKWGNLGKAADTGKSKVVAPKPVRDASGSRRTSTVSKSSSTLEPPSASGDRKLSIASTASTSSSDKCSKARSGQRQPSDSSNPDACDPPSTSHEPRPAPDAFDAFHLVATGDAGALSRSKTDHILKSARIHADLNLAYATMLGNHLTLRKMAQERLDKNESCEDLEFLLQAGADQLDSLQANLELVNRIRDGEVQAALGQFE